VSFRDMFKQESAPCFVIAEIGVNHEGSVETCAQMIEAAAKAGADAIKLQTMDADENYLPGTESHEIFSSAALSRSETAQMFHLARERGIEPFTTAGDRYTLAWVLELDPCAVKISSGLLTHLPLIREAAGTGYPLIMSTGMAADEQIDAAMTAVRTGGASDAALLHCTSIYPAPKEETHLSRIAWLRDRHKTTVGYSDHYSGTEAAVLAVAAGARILEKHLSLTPTREGYDHRLSLDPEQFGDMVRQIRSAEALLGAPNRELSLTEKTNATRFHRIIVARRKIASGATLGVDDIGFRRPPAGTQGLPPTAYDAIVGRVLQHDLEENDPIILAHVGA
jgi:sialic acid synthase SpsE